MKSSKNEAIKTANIPYILHGDPVIIYRLIGLLFEEKFLFFSQTHC